MKTPYKLGFLFLLASLLLHLLCYNVLYRSPLTETSRESWRREFDNAHLANCTLTDAHFHTQFMLSYYRNLAAYPRHGFQRPEKFKCLGSPVSSVAKQPENETKPNVKRILAWTEFFGTKDWIPKTICSGNKICVSTTDKNDLTISDGIVIHPRDLVQKSDLPTNRLPHQRLIYLIQESPWATGIDVGDYDGVFNWTSTYRRDSDFPFTFFWTGRRQTVLSKQKREKIATVISSKTKLIAYMNSNCNAAHSKRMEFIEELNSYIHVDMYGKCGNLTCPRNSEVCTNTMAKYKFYLSLENTHCRHYLTEKVQQPLQEWYAVPVVMGGADPSDYETILPPHSYIHTSGFSSTRDLVDYLLLLDRNPELYQQYHAWRRTHQRVRNDIWCDICHGLHNASLPIQTYTDFKGWYREDVCRP
ncbi:3-galactosyl-N-acetylglucosaminide 4-alpha-L-fucosyltransferase FUT3-like [Liolophura sinensis]|uniref:3-galactosyl-N-acetylglucosaminide 4-alpha-L-fucosyltransferase FUT3-like n=1 Tax=Liolophura sinensis TaxID=3198878 RepID=UPI003158C49C